MASQGPPPIGGMVRSGGCHLKQPLKRANLLALIDLALGIPVVVLTTVVGTSVFATLQESLNTRIRIIGGLLIVFAAVLASLHTWLHLGELVEKNRVAAESWAAIRREIK